jgi:hypothetical protein
LLKPLSIVIVYVLQSCILTTPDSSGSKTG